jgi:hypothetical protein
MACADYATKLCERTQTCTPALFTDSGFITMADCVSWYEASCTADVQAPHSGFTAILAEVCGDVLAETPCDQYVQGGSPSPNCSPNGGTIPAGGSCSTSWQCASGQCFIEVPNNCGFCVDPFGAGQACGSVPIPPTWMGPFCALGLFCSATQPGSSARVCSTPVGVGGPCQDGAVCPGNSYCDATTNTCAKLPGVGEACDPSRVNLCDVTGPFARCDPATSTCVAPAITPFGGACPSPGGDFVELCVAECVGGANAGTCRQIRNLGQTCSDQTFCIGDATCTNGVCATLACGGV